ncbi:hypothetical protein HB780_00590 (plasmid) [Rhizobium lusitanum]|uniref:hypothetical protein n=1 Tax=Rhizobium lusitanum TaxID=293958 RepID=UPI00161C302E|nr:hypothetical protein HB780_00590 [Rhizobium lusitanum]
MWIFNACIACFGAIVLCFLFRLILRSGLLFLLLLCFPLRLDERVPQALNLCDLLADLVRIDARQLVGTQFCDNAVSKCDEAIDGFNILRTRRFTDKRGPPFGANIKRPCCEDVSGHRVILLLARIRRLSARYPTASCQFAATIVGSVLKQLGECTKAHLVGAQHLPDQRIFQNF